MMQKIFFARFVEAIDTTHDLKCKLGFFMSAIEKIDANVSIEFI